ncbi:2-amino-4-hydroxy-6-hydroxymethyldihydropteridine diphosphokinase [Algoriphagus namhaensis]|uniref:2-amino-4-hydroxy-6-hydroxymethyldihydropteridine pyrophosphokinase n=1 Tax=Algoriphagus namhaensis TaxID=915353 RepID=A0ABV8AQH4_9BACT
MNSTHQLFKEAVLLIGGNKGDREFLINSAKTELSKKMTLLAESSIYESEAWGHVAKGDFLNQVLLVSTTLSALELLQYNQSVESKLGRKRSDHWGDRTMDIDILYFGEEIIQTDELKIPHPFIAERRFTLMPLVELLPDKLHPNGLTHLEMLSKCEDKGRVWKYAPKPENL